MKWLSSCLLIACASVAHAATFIVNVGGATLSYSPQTITVDPGDTVVFINKGGLHNVKANDNSFRCAIGCDTPGNNTPGNPSSTSWVARVTFNNPGSIGYYCEIHGKPGAGMFGTVNVTGQVPTPPARIAVPGGNAMLYFLLVVVLALAAAMRLPWRRR